jgi:hypothetical protein
MLATQKKKSGHAADSTRCEDRTKQTKRCQRFKLLRRPPHTHQNCATLTEMRTIPIKSHQSQLGVCVQGVFRVVRVGCKECASFGDSKACTAMPAPRGSPQQMHAAVGLCDACHNTSRCSLYAQLFCILSGKSQEFLSFLR